MGPLAELSFDRPEVLWLLPLALLLGGLLFVAQRRSRRAAERIQSVRLRGEGLPARRVRPAVTGLAALMAIIALAGPELGYEEITLSTSSDALVVVLDTSQSMLAEDVGASRLAAGKVLIEEILSRYTGKVGLVVFEGTAEVVSPLTDDTLAVATLLRSIGAGELEKAGSDFRAAVSTAIGLLERNEITEASIVLVSDGENRGTDWRGAVDLVEDRVVVVHTVLVGGVEGEVIRIEGGLLRDEYGAPVRTSADPQPLEALARATGGEFFENPFGSGAVDQIEREISAGSRLTEMDQTRRVPRDRYQFPLSIAFFLLVAGTFLDRGAE